jgi:hypothetical protein
MVVDVDGILAFVELHAAAEEEYMCNCAQSND